jgi:D-threo-aldose 1-dehydrogenase
VSSERSATAPERPALALPRLGFGGASVGNLYRAWSDEESMGAMRAAIQCGVSYFDTAPYYGHGLSEVRIGRFLAETDAEIFLSTKVGRVLEPSGPGGPSDNGFVDPLPFEPIFDYSYDGVMRSFDQSCARLGVDRVDLLFMHDIGAAQHGADAHAALFELAMRGGAKAMAELRAEGRAGAIGLGVNEWQVCMESLEFADFDVFMLSVRYTLLEQTPLDGFFDACLQRGVGIVAAAPFNSGLLARRADASSHYNYASAPHEVVERAQRLFDFCASRGVALQAAALQFPLLHPVVRCVVTGMATAERVRESCAWLEAPLPDGFWDELKAAGLLRADAPTAAA